MRRATGRIGSIVLAATATFAAVASWAVPVGATAQDRTRVPDLVGTWTGHYSYPSTDGSVHPSRETLVIETQRGVHLWGYDEFIDSAGQTVRIPVLGTVVDGDIGLAEKSGFFVGRLTAKHRMVLRFVLVGERPTSFHVDLKRSNP